MDCKHELIACLHETDLINANIEFNTEMVRYNQKVNADPNWDKFFIKGPRTVNIKPMWWVCGKCDKILQEPTDLKVIKVWKDDIIE